MSTGTIDALITKDNSWPQFKTPQCDFEGEQNQANKSKVGIHSRRFLFGKICN
jgi:hypothetical protein